MSCVLFGKQLVFQLSASSADPYLVRSFCSLSLLLYMPSSAYTQLCTKWKLLPVGVIQVMSEGPSDTGPVPVPTPDLEQPHSPANSTASQRLYQQQVQQHLLQQQQQVQQQVQVQQQQVQQQQVQVQQQQQAQQQIQHQQQQLNPQFQQPNLGGYLGQLPGLGLPYGSQMPPGQLQGSYMPGQGMSGLSQHQLPVFSEPMNQGAPMGQLGGVQHSMLGSQSKQKLHQQTSMVGQIPASAGQQDSRQSGGSNNSLPMPNQANFGMIGQLPEQYLKGRNAPVGQFPQLHQQPSSFGFPNNYMGQPMNLPLASAGMSLPSGPSMSNVSQYSFAQPYNMFPQMHGSHVGSLDGSAYNVPDSASVMSQQRPVIQPAAPGPVVSLASLGTVQKVSVHCDLSCIKPSIIYSS